MYFLPNMLLFISLASVQRLTDPGIQASLSSTPLTDCVVRSYTVLEKHNTFKRRGVLGGLGWKQKRPHLPECKHRGFQRTMIYTRSSKNPQCLQGPLPSQYRAHWLVSLNINTKNLWMGYWMEKSDKHTPSASNHLSHGHNWPMIIWKGP